MRSKFTRLAANLASFTGAAALFCGLSAPAHAQFQSIFGGDGDDAAMGGIVPTKDEYIAVGQTNSFGGSQDVYIVKSDACGDLVWARYYDLGGDDVGRKIRYDAKRDVYIVVGSTENKYNCCTTNDAFLMEIDADGNVNWARTYGGADDDQGADVRIHDDVYYFTGRTESFGAGKYDGWIGAVRNDGQLLWTRTYGGADDDGFNSIDIGCNASLIVAGDTRSYTLDGNQDVFVVKTDLSGTSAGGGWSRHYGGKLDDVGRSIVNYYDKYFYVAGYTGKKGSTDAYVLQGLCDNGGFVRDRLFTVPNVSANDCFNEIQIYQQDALILTGFVQDDPNGFKSYDVLLTVLKVDLNPGYYRVYGEKGDEMGWSITEVKGSSEPYNFLMAGWTNSFSNGSTDLYEIRTSLKGIAPCYTKETKLAYKDPGYKDQDAPTNNPLIRVACNVEVGGDKVDGWKRLCSDCDKERQSDGDGQELSLGGGLVDPVQATATVTVRAMSAR